MKLLPIRGSSSEGWVDTSLPPGVVGYAVFRQTVPGRADQEAVVPLTSESNQAADLVYDDVQFTTSIAFLNPSDQPVTVSIATYTASGIPNGSAQVMLAPRSKQAVELKNLPGLEGIAGNRGWAAFSVSNGAVSVLCLRFGGQAFTSIQRLAGESACILKRQLWQVDARNIWPGSLTSTHRETIV